MFNLKELRERRLVQIVIAYLAGGWVAITIIGELTDRGVTPEVWYRIGLVLFLIGIPGAFIAGWFHGEKGHQRVTRTEIALFSILGIAALFAVNSVYQASLRPQTAADLDAPLDASSIAVLYFEDDSDGGELAYVADGLTEDLIDQLSRVGSLDVVSRNGSALYRDSDLPMDRIAEALDVGTIVRGSVSGDESSVEVTVRLIDGASGSEIERDGFRVAGDELLDLKESIAVEISQSLRSWLGRDLQMRRSRNAAANVAAWALVQRGRRAAERAEEAARHDGLGHAAEGFAEADSLFAEAARVDTLWVEPHLARGRYEYIQSRLADDVDALLDHAEAGLAHAESALDRDGQNAEAYDIRGTIRYWLFLVGAEADPDARARLLQQARADLEQAIARGQLATSYSTVSHLYYRDDVSSAVLAARSAYQEDAYLDVANEVLWRLYTGTYDLEQFVQARQWCAEGFRRFPDDFRFSECRLWLASTPIGDLEPDSAWAIRDHLLSVTPDGREEYETVLSRLLVAGALGRADMSDSARAVLDATGSVGFEADPTQDLLSIEAFVRSTIGDDDEAMGLLRRYMIANPDHAFHVGDDLSWWWDELQDHPEFESLYADH